MRWWLSIVLCLPACAAPDAWPLVESHRGGAGYWPENSRTAVHGSIMWGVDALEIDLGLTADDVPVLVHDAWIDARTCTRSNGARLHDAALAVRDFTLAELQSGFLCGARPDPEHPNAVVWPEAIATLDEVLVALRRARTDMVIHLDIKADDRFTASDDAFAEAVLSRWIDAELPQPFYVSAGYPSTLAAFDAYGRTRGFFVPTSLAWPHFVPAEPGRPSGEVGIAVRAELARLAGTRSAVNDALDAGAHGLAMYWELADPLTVRRARAAGLSVQLWTLNDPEVLRHHARWPVYSLITDYPLDAP